MALNKIYTDNVVVKKYNGGNIAWVATKPYKELFGENEFDLSILLNNSSTSKMLNNGAYGGKPTKYNSSNVVASGENTTPIQFLGCFLSTNDSYGIAYGINVTQKITMQQENIGGDSWQQFIDNFRFIVDFVPADGVSYQNYQDFDYYNTTKVKYGFSSTYLVFNALYNTSNVQLFNRSETSNPESITGDNSKRFLRASLNVVTTNYNKFMGQNDSLIKESLATLWYAFRVNGDLIIIREPDYITPSSDYNKVRFLLSDNSEKYLTIGGFSNSVEDGTTGGLPDNDDTKGLFVGQFAVSGQFRRCNFYYSTNNAIMHNANSTGIRWTVNNIDKAEQFRENVRLGVMDENGLITHNEWIQGESAIANSDNPNKNGNYSDLPEWKPSGGDKDDIDDIALTMSTVNNAAFRRLFALNSTELNQLEAALSGNYLEPLPSGFDPLQSVISLSVFPWDITNVNWISCNTIAGAEITISGWNSGVTGNYITGATSAFIELGSFNVEHRHNNFLDYAPYTTVSVYVPYCGEIELPTNLVMGQSVRVFLIYDIPSGSCRAVIKSSNGAILGTIAGNFSSEIEVTSSEAGLKKQSIISTSLNTTGQVVSTAIGVVKEDISAATGGIVGSLGAVSQSIASMNKNYTSSVGTTDGMVNFFMPDQCYIKITRPKVSIPSNYGHTTGYACNKTMKLGELIPGNYYVANNPDLSNSLGNEEEKTMLKAALENGFFK